MERETVYKSDRNKCITKHKRCYLHSLNWKVTVSWLYSTISVENLNWKNKNQISANRLYYQNEFRCALRAAELFLFEFRVHSF